MVMSFKKIRDKARVLSPFQDFALVEIPFEIRFDPLTGQTGRIFDLPYKAEKPDVSRIVGRSREVFCPFCTEKLEDSTPLFPKELIPGGRLRVGDATLIPNMVPFDSYAGVSILSPQHYIPMEGLSPEAMRDAFFASLEFIRRVAAYDPEVCWFSINWNYMPPSGSSLVHPHLQPNCGSVPTNEQRAQLEGCRRYHEERKRDFWFDFMETEKTLDERFIGEIGSTFWAMSYVPFGFLPDIWIIFSQNHSLAEVREMDIIPFLQGLSRVLRYFQEENIFSFNLSLFSHRTDQLFRINGRITPRLLPRPIGNSDNAYHQVLHKEPFTVKPPESVCRSLREAWQEGV